ncbi:MAG: helix-turn-helix domain-containing protein [Thermoplasmata archaeon]
MLGRRRTLLVLRDVSFFPNVRFRDILRNNKGLSARMLSMRSRELQKEGLIVRSEDLANSREVHYHLTKTRRGAVPILSAFIQYGTKHRASKVSKDGRPRTMGQLFPGDRGYMLGDLQDHARSSGMPSRPARPTRSALTGFADADPRRGSRRPPRA